MCDLKENKHLRAWLDHSIVALCVTGRANSGWKLMLRLQGDEGGLYADKTSHVLNIFHFFYTTILFQGEAADLGVSDG